MSSAGSIGVFDSGVGGLTVIKELIKILPNENIIYLGDTARVPYGNKSKKTVTRFATECASFLNRFNIKMIVIACNTASSYSLKEISKNFNLPIIDVIKPAVKKACAVTKNNRIGIIGTKATVNSKTYISEIKKIKKHIKVYQKACPLFVPLVEEGWLDNPITYEIGRKYLSDLSKKKVDTLILGCTHYPLLTKVIKSVFKNKVNIINSAKTSSFRIREVLMEKGALNKKTQKGKIKIYVTDDPAWFKKVSSVFFRNKTSIKKAQLT